MKLVTLDYIVKNVIASLEETTLRRYQTYLQYSIRGFREIGLFATTTTKIAYLPMLPNKAVDLPSDYTKYCKIGVVVNGRVILLGLDDSLVLNDSFNSCGDPIEIAMGVANGTISDASLALYNFGFYFLDHYHNGQFVGGMFGLGGGFNGRGYYRVNESANQIQFSSEVGATTIVLEYISDGLSPDGTASVPVQAVECLLAWTHWKRLEFKKGVTLGEKQDAERRYIIEFRKLKHFELMFTANEYLDSYRTNVDQVIKR